MPNAAAKLKILRLKTQRLLEKAAKAAEAPKVIPSARKHKAEVGEVAKKSKIVRKKK